MIIIDNFLNKTYANEIEHQCINNIAYEYSRNTSYNSNIIKDENTYDVGQFSCLLLETNVNHYFANFIRPMIFMAHDVDPRITIKGIGRVKINILLKQDFPSNHYNCPHHDSVDTDSITMVYYINDSDGDTVLFNEFYEPNKVPDKFTVYKRISPQKNRLVIFESNRYHASSNPKISQDRFVINFILEGSI